MPTLTLEQILALAPDDSSRKAGQGLAAPSKWVSASSSERAIWGECQGSGSKPYQTVADTEALAFKCSCPSRKFPCKHGIGLLLYHAKDAGRFNTGAEPAWVAEWLDKRAQRGPTAASKEEKPVTDKGAQAKRSAAREEKVSAGIEELLLWVKDVMRTGLLTLPEKGERYFEDVAKRLVDTQSPGLARAVSVIGDINYFGEGWQTEVLDSFARLYMAASGFRAIDSQDAALAADLRSFIGYPQGAELLEGQPILPDTWMVTGSETEQEGSLTVEKHWLASSEGRRGLFLQYLPYGARPGVSLFAGQQFCGDVVYYPSASPLRVAIRSLSMNSNATAIPGLSGWEEVVNRESDILAQAPLSGALPHVLTALRPVKAPNNTWLIEDKDGKQMRLRAGFKDIWKWIALGGGDYLPTAVLGAEHTYAPLGVWHQANYIQLN